MTNSKKTKMAHLDPVTLALVQNRLDHIATQMGWVMIRTSRSPIFNQSHDFSCFVTDGFGNLISQADGIPIHTGGGGFAIRALLDKFGDKIHPGDVYILNDPYEAGGNHLPDYGIARPVFANQQLIAFACNRAHQSDIGGGAAGTYNPQATEIFHEGIRLPPLYLVEKGKLREDLWHLLMLNTRCPDLMDGDLRAMMGSTEIGAQQIEKIVLQMGQEQTLNCFNGILDHAEKLMRLEIAAAPDGTYLAEESFDNDCFEPVDVRIKVTLTIDGEGMTVDFSGTSPQIKGFKNSSLANTYSAVYAAVASFFDHDIPRNEGTFRPIKIIAPEGTVVNALAPAAVTMCTVFPAYEIIHACWWALGAAVPERNCAGWGKNSFPNSSGQRTDGSTWVMYHWGGLSGAGAVNGRDGFNQIGPLITLGGLTIPNAETYEQLYPVAVQKQEFRCDTAGAGKYRGGAGVDYKIVVEEPVEYSFRAEGVTRRTGLGVEGGGDGAQGAISLCANDGQQPGEMPPAYGLWRRPPGVLSIASPAGGGYGDPRTRRPGLVLRDVRDEIITAQSARDIYGVVLMKDGLTVDEVATRALRKRDQ
jgi:N-methylhydantoinase B